MNQALIDASKMLEEIKSGNTKSIQNILRVDVDSLYQTQPFYVTSLMRMNWGKMAKEKGMATWNKENNLYMVLPYVDKKQMTSFIHTDVHMFYETNDLSNNDNIGFNNGEKYIVLGTLKPQKTNSARYNSLLLDMQMPSWDLVSTNDELQASKDKYFNDSIHIFNVAQSVCEELTINAYQAKNIVTYLREKNCFDMTNGANNVGKYKVKMQGNIIITDPCYIIKNREDREFWDELNLSCFGFTNYLTHNTLYGDWGCHTFDMDTQKAIGEFCADGGEVGVFLLDEVLKYNPNYDDYLKAKHAVTLIKDFNGEVWFEKLDRDTLVVRGEGSTNFITKQTSF